jgi:two-component system sensor histidine kinase MtrB
VTETAGTALVDLAERTRVTATAAAAAVRRWLQRLRERWGRSLQLRVIMTTLVLSAVVVSVLGYFLMQRFVSDLYASKLRAGQNVAQAGLHIAQTPPYAQDFRGPPGPSASVNMKTLAYELATPSVSPAYSQTGTELAVLVTLNPNLQGQPVFGGGQQEGFSVQPAIPAKMAHDVRFGSSPSGLWSMWTRMAVGSGGSSSKPVAGLLIGGQFGTAGEYQLYYFFPLTAEQQTIAAIQRDMLLVGIAAVFLLAAIAWLVTRWVVVPVRQAASGARRLSAGHLAERMEVHGNDELASLATAFNELAASLQEKLAELEDLSQVQRQFVSDVSHELRTPLTTIRIAADVLFGTKAEMEPAAARSSELLQSQLERFESLLTDLLEISRYDANAATLDAEPADIGTIIRQSADVAQQLAERRGSRIEFRLSAEACIAEVDRRRVERILRNLLENAVEHGEDKDVIVTAAADSAAVAVSVRDFGVGLRPGEDQLVFDRFWRADPARARTTGGTGLGLAIALEDARLHGGWLEAWGEPGRGCVFRVTLPRMAGTELHGSPLPLCPDQEVSLPDYAGLDAIPDLVIGVPLGLASAGNGEVQDRNDTSAGAGALDGAGGVLDGAGVLGGAGTAQVTGTSDAAGAQDAAGAPDAAGTPDAADAADASAPNTGGGLEAAGAADGAGARDGADAATEAGVRG